MKTRVALIAAAMLASAIALAHPHGGHAGPDMERMAVLLDLIDAQKAEVQKVLDEQHEKLRAVHEEQRSAGTTPTREDRVKFHEQLKQDMLARLQSVLSPEQIKKFEVLMDRPHPHGERSR